MEIHRKKILVIGPVPSKSSGGIASFLGFMLDSPLLRERYSLICLDNTLTPGLRAGRLRRLAGTFLLTVRLLWLLVSRRPALVHIHTSARLSFWEKVFMLNVCRMFRRPTVLHIHGSAFDSFCRASRLKPLIRAAFNRADVLVVLSRYWQDFCRPYTRTRIEVIPNCAGEVFFSRPPVLGRGEAIVFVGETGPRKGVDVLLEAVGHLRLRGIDNPLLLAGAGADAGLIDLYRAAVEEKKLGEVRFLGNLRPAELLDLFARAAVFTLPSTAEGLPISMLEAMAAGLPLVVTPVGGVPEVVEEGVNGFLVPVADSLALARSLERLLLDPDLRRRIGERNHREAEQKFHPNVTARALDDLYRSLTEPRGSRSQPRTH